MSANSPSPAAALAVPAPAKSDQASAKPGSYGQILKSSALIGGSSVVRIVLGIVRVKAMAVLLGPPGIGLLAIYGSIADLAQSVAGMGINTSGVRQIAEATGSEDSERIARTVTALRRVALWLGLLGAVMLVALCQPVSLLSFGDYHHAGMVALLSLAVFFGAVSSGQIALVQGMRRIGDLAMASVWGALYGTVFSIGLVLWMGEQGVVPSLVCVAGMGIITSWWYSRKIRVQRVVMRLADISAEVSNLLKLGFLFMSTGLMMQGVAYLVRIIVAREMGAGAAGHYQAAWSLGGLYVTIILQAMGADFFPRLTAVARDDRECNRLMNEQAEVSLLLAGPGILGTLTFAPVVVQLFYSTKFGPAVEVLRWICLGMMLRVASWPMGFVLLAKGTRRPYFWSELVTNLVQLALVWLGVMWFGLKGTGMAFFGGYVFYWFLIYAVVRSVSGFRWTAANKRVGLFYGVLIAAIFVGEHFLPLWALMIGGGALSIVATVYSLRTLCRLVPLGRMPGPVQRLVRLLRLAP